MRASLRQIQFLAEEESKQRIVKPIRREEDLCLDKGDYHPKKTLDHTHLGSLGNLALDEIQNKMEQALNS